jgi:acyl-coenzyme A thioesterase PaaI-like protein
MVGQSRRRRREQLVALLEAEPFLTDEELAERFSVSVPTIRLDRLSLGIPEVRGRIKALAEKSVSSPTSIDTSEIIGQLLDLELGKFGISLFEIGPQHVFSRTKMARGHHVFAQANSLAIAVVDAVRVVTAVAEIRFIRPVYLGERLIAKATVKQAKRDHTLIEVVTKMNQERVFEGQFLVSRLKEDQKQNVEQGGRTDANLR